MTADLKALRDKSDELEVEVLDAIRLINDDDISKAPYPERSANWNRYYAAHENYTAARKAYLAARKLQWP